jgi:hypothetical protein
MTNSEPEQCGGYGLHCDSLGSETRAACDELPECSHELHFHAAQLAR